MDSDRDTDTVGRYDYGVDVWSAACVIIECFTGEPLFPCSSMEEFADQLVRLHGGPIRNVKLLDVSRSTKAALQNASSKMTTIQNSQNYQHMTMTDQLEMMMRASASGRDDCRLLIDLLTRMLSVDFRRRPTARECLRHAFFEPKKRRTSDSSEDPQRPRFSSYPLRTESLCVVGGVHHTPKFNPIPRTRSSCSTAARTSKEIANDVVSVYHAFTRKKRVCESL
jgi:serine/threonine protein kinase